MQVGSRGFQQIIPLLMMDTEEYNKLKDAIRQANDGLAASVPGMANTHMQLSLLNLTIQSAGAAIFDKLKPAIDSVVKSFQYFASYIRDASKEGGALSGTFELVAGTARLVAAAIVSITSGILAFGVAVEGVAKLAAGQIDQFEKSAADTAKALETIGTELKARLAEIWSAPIPVTVRPPGVDARAMNEGLAKAMSERLKIIQDEYKLETDIINKRYGDFFFVENAKTNALLAALDKRYNEEVKAGETTTLAYAKWALDRQKILDAANKSYEFALNNVFSGVQSAFNSQLRGMLAGTTSFATAFKSILGDMIIWAIQEFEKMAFKWIAHEVIQTTATEAGVAARTGAEATGAAASAGLGVASAIRAIMNSAAEMFRWRVRKSVPYTWAGGGRTGGSVERHGCQHGRIGGGC